MELGTRTGMDELSLVPGAERRGKRAPGVHCSRMRQVSMVTCILLRYTKITTNFSLPARRPDCRTMLLTIKKRMDLKSEIISFDGNGLHRFVRGIGKLQRKDYVIACSRF